MIIITTKKKLQRLIAEAVKDLTVNKVSKADATNIVRKGTMEFTSPVGLVELPSKIKIGDTLIRIESLNNPNGDGGK